MNRARRPNVISKQVKERDKIFHIFQESLVGGFRQ